MTIQHIFNSTIALAVRFHFEAAVEAFQQEGPLMAARRAANATWRDYEAELDDRERAELERELSMRVHEARLAQLSYEIGEAPDGNKSEVAERLIEELTEAEHLSGDERIDLFSHLEWLIAGVIGEERARAFMEDHGVPNLRAPVTPVAVIIREEIAETLSAVGEADTLERIGKILIKVVTDVSLSAKDKSALLTELESKVHAHNMALLREEGDVTIEEIANARTYGEEWVNSFIEWAQEGNRHAA